MAYPSNAISAQGTQFKRGDGGSPETFTLVGEVKSFDGPGGSAQIIDVSTLQSLAKEKRIGLPDEGQFSFTLNLDPSDTQQLGLKSDRASGVVRNFKLVLPNVAATTLSFSALVPEFKISGGVNGVVEAQCALEITGAVVWS